MKKTPAPSARRMKVLVGIPTHKRPELLRECLESIAAQKGSLPEVEVFVADNDSKGREGASLVAELAGKFRYPLTSTVVDEPGISAVRNAILDEAQRHDVDFIVMIDDDETASPEWLGQLLSAQQALAVGVVGGPVTPMFPDSVPDWYRVAFRRRTRPTGIVDLVDATSNVLISCEALKSIGWPEFDSGYGLSGGGDTEFFLRARDLGLTFGWANDAMVCETIESERLRTRWVLRRYFRYGIIRHRLAQKYHMDGTPTPYWIALNLAASPLLLALAIYPKLRIRALRRVAYVSGLLAGAFGIKFYEYASRH